MESYKDVDGDSGVIAYEIGDNYIDVQFSSRKVYKYTYQSAGSGNIEAMKKLARSGNGLNSFIMRRVKTLFVK